MTHKVLLLLPLLVVAIYANHQTYPGTSTRPVLSDTEAALYTKHTYLQGWSPSVVSTSTADYVVGSGGYATIQAAVNAAIKAGGTTRKHIKIKKGTYAQAVLIPQTTVPLTLYGTPGTPSDVHIVLSQGANLSGANYAKQVNPNGAVYKQGDPAWSMYNQCATKSVIGTLCSAIFWAQNDNLELAYVTIENPSLDGQAVAVSAAGDKQNFEHVHFYGFQDTLFSEGARVFYNSVTVKGDVDFIFGGGSAVFANSQITARADRPRNSAIIFAPSTDNGKKYGFLVIDSKISAESGIASAKSCHLARAWDASSNPNANGQVVIRETHIDDVINVSAPYETATSGRAYAGNTKTNRNLDDSSYNRFWEYKNTGSGA